MEVMFVKKQRKVLDVSIEHSILVFLHPDLQYVDD